MKKNKLVALVMALVIAVGIVATPAHAASIDTGVSKHAAGSVNMFLLDRYKGESYDATLDEMKSIEAKCHETNTQVGTPSTIKVTADSIESAKTQIAAALKFAPNSIAVTFTDAVSTADIDTFCNTYKNWKSTGNQIDLFISAIQTYISNPLTVTRTGSTVKFDITYAEGWLASVDAQDWLRCYANEEFSAKLEEFVRTYVDQIAEQMEAGKLSDWEAIYAVTQLVEKSCGYDYDAIKAYARGGSYDTSCHSIYGFIMNGKAVCDGLSYTVQCFSNYLGIDCFVVVGHNSTGSHAWNKMKIDDVWYVTDMTNILSTKLLAYMTWMLTEDKYESYTPYMSWCNSIYAAVTESDYATPLSMIRWYQGQLKL